MSDAAAVLRGIFNDYQLEIAGPDVDRGIAAVRSLEEQLEAAREEQANRLANIASWIEQGEYKAALSAALKEDE